MCDGSLKKAFGVVWSLGVQVQQDDGQPPKRPENRMEGKPRPPVDERRRAQVNNRVTA
jgi:hypothetical protein